MFSATGKKVYSIYFYSILTSTVATRPRSERGHRIIFVSPITHAAAFRLPHDPSLRVQSVFRLFLFFFLSFFLSFFGLTRRSTGHSSLVGDAVHDFPRFAAVFGSPSEHNTPNALIHEYGVGI